MSKTKSNILKAALKLFNRDGMVNVRLQHIADEALISVGNLAYHYENKETLLSAICEALTKSQQDLLAEFRVVPLFDNIDRLIHQTFLLQEQHKFFYLDTLEIIRAYPSIGRRHQEHIHSQIAQLKTILDFNAARGALSTEQYEGGFERLANQMWMTMDFWTTQQAITSSEKNEYNNYRLAIWNLLMPHFTEMGRREYQQMLEKPYDIYF